MYSRKYVSIIILICSVFSFQAKAQNGSFTFPENRLGSFAQSWYKAINLGKTAPLESYDILSEDWKDYFQMMASIAKRAEGISPRMLSYQTENSISIYSQEGTGRWVLVNLSVNSKNQILEMSIKKSFEPKTYALQSGMSTSQVESVMMAMAKEFKTNYVVPEKRAELEDFMLEKMKSETYLQVAQGDLLAIKLTRDLVKFANDKHLQVIPPSRFLEVEMRFGTSGPNVDTNLDQPDNQELHTADKEKSASLPITGEILEGNIGYIRLERFVDAMEVKVATEQIMNDLQGVRAVIVDLTQSGGGDGVAVDNLLAYFFDEEVLDDLKYVDQPKALSAYFKDKPLYVLTSKRSISAAEGFAYFLKKKKRAKLIGQTTAGAGYLVDAFKLPFDFYLVNSIATNFDANKGEGWQGKGVIPDVKTSASKAKAKALEMIN